MATNPLNGIRTYDPMTANAPADTSSTTGTSATDQTQKFLTLLIAQIKNQDPMAPMDASTMTAQMSQLNMVSSIGNMNTSMTAMLNQMQSVNFMNQAALIGHSPAVAGNGIAFDGTNQVMLGANSTNPLQSVVATITDASGNTINSVSLGSTQAGMTNFVWSGKDANGQPHVGGLYLSNDDRVQQTRMFKEVEDTGSDPYDPYKVYQPTLGTATPGTFGITKDSCMVVKEKVDCSTKQTFNSPNCTQCYTSQTFSRVDPKTGRLPSTLFLFGRGKVKVSGVINLNDFFDLSETRDIQITIPADAEGKNFLITVNASSSPPTYLAGYLEGTTARGTFKIDLITLIQADTQTSAKPKMNGTKKVNGFRCYSMVPASGKSQMTLACLMPFSFINMFDGDALACDNGPIITKESSATFLQSDPCFGPKNSPGNYTKDCLQSRWLSMNGTQDGTGYPTDAATMDKLQKNADGSPRDLDTIVDGMVGVVNKALTGKNDAGQMLSIPEWNDASMYVTGVPINTPCDGPGSQPPLSQQCLSYLYANQGNGGRIGSTYTMPPGKYASALQEGFEV